MIRDTDRKDPTMTDLQISAPPGVPQIITDVDLDAPRYVVFRAFMEPDLLSQWLGPRRVTMTIEEYDPRDGGRYHYTHHDAEGNAYAFHGVFHGDPSLERSRADVRVRGRAGARRARDADSGGRGRDDARAHQLRVPVGRGPRRHGAQRAWRPASPRGWSASRSCSSG